MGILKISEDVLQKVKEENDIVDIISETVRLKRTGRNYSGLCPFHNEKTPSFSVSSEKQIYKCFGCGEAGNVITFLMKTRGLTFIDAVKILADKANIELQLNDENGDIKSVYDKLYKINVEAARYFYYSLKKSKTSTAYFVNRGITEDTIKKFGLGYSVESWDSIIMHLKSKGFSDLDMLSAGLIVKKQNSNSYYDRFRNRVMFPVFDYRGRVIGFGGRVLDDSKPKYLNTSETPVFKKGINLYGLNFAIKSNTIKEIIVVEGYMDCVALHQYGITNVVASLGTALTINQAKLLKRYASKVIISYDADVAGEMATIRGLEVLKNVGLQVSVLSIPQGKDPDEYIRNNGREAFISLIKEAKSLIEYRMYKERQNMDLKNPESIIQYAEKALSILQELDAIEREVYIKQLSEETNIKPQVLYDMLNNRFQKNVKNSETLNTHSEIGQKLYLEPAYLKAERGILKYMVSQIETFNLIIDSMEVEDLVLEAHKKIFNLIGESIELEYEERKKYIEARCDDIETSKEWINIVETNVQEGEDFKRITSDYIKEINKYKLEETKKEIMIKIKQYEKKGMVRESLELARELDVIQKKVRKFQ